MRLDTPRAILLGFALIAASLLLLRFAPEASAQRFGPYSLMQNSNPNNGNLVPGVFRVDQSTGGVAYCLALGGNGGTRVECTAEAGAK